MVSLCSLHNSNLQFHCSLSLCLAGSLQSALADKLSPPESHLVLFSSPHLSISVFCSSRFLLSISTNTFMASTLTNFLSKPPSVKVDSFASSASYSSTTAINSFRSGRRRPAALQSTRPRSAPVVVASAAASGTRKVEKDERVRQVHSIDEFDAALRSAKNKLVVVEFAASHSYHSRKIYPFMVDLSRTCNDVEFLLVMGDESDSTRQLCDREKIEQVPHFSFYKNREKVHEEEGIGPDQLMGDVLYYGDNHSAVVQLHHRDDVEKLIAEHKGDGKLLVLDVGLKHCGPCVKVYPTVLKLSKMMTDTVVFARMNGDENESCMGFLKDMDVVEVPTFLFIRDGEICGRYVGSGKGELIGEILRYQGVRVT